MLQDTNLLTAKGKMPNILMSRPIVTFEEARGKELRELRVPTFPQEFVAWVAEKTTEMLIARLKSRGDSVSEKLLNCLVVLLLSSYQYNKNGKITGLNNEIIVDTVGEITRDFQIWNDN